MAWRRGQLLGPQRDDPHARLRRPRRSARVAGAQAIRRPRAQPRFRRGRADAPRRLGHRTWCPTCSGSYEEGPPTLIDLLIRDRRWCQGNLQHCQGGGRQGPALDQPHAHDDRHRPLLHRHDVGDADADRHRDPAVRRQASTWPPRFPSHPRRYWRTRADNGVLWVFALTMGVLLAPKLLGYLALLLNRNERRGCGVRCGRWPASCWKRCWLR